MALITDISLKVIAELSKSADLSNPTQSLSYLQKVQYTNGTGAGQADLLWSDTREIPASSNDDLDLVGSLSDAFGTTFSAARIKALIVKAAVGNTNNVVIGDAASNVWSSLLGTDGTVVLRPGAFFGVTAGPADAVAYPCSAGSTDILRVANSGAGSTVEYDIIVVGVSQ